MRGKVAKALRRHARFLAEAENVPEAWKVLYKRLKRRWKEEKHG